MVIFICGMFYPYIDREPKFWRKDFPQHVQPQLASRLS